MIRLKVSLILKKMHHSALLFVVGPFNFQHHVLIKMEVRKYTNDLLGMRYSKACRELLPFLQGTHGRQILNIGKLIYFVALSEPVAIKSLVF
jgi:hypothetical protein